MDGCMNGGRESRPFNAHYYRADNIGWMNDERMDEKGFLVWSGMVI